MFYGCPLGTLLTYTEVNGNRRRMLPSTGRLVIDLRIEMSVPVFVRSESDMDFDGQSKAMRPLTANRNREERPKYVIWNRMTMTRSKPIAISVDIFKI